MKQWKEFLSHQDTVLTPSIVDKWLRSLAILHFDARNLYLEAPDIFYATWFEEHIREKAERFLCNDSGHPIMVHLSLPKQNFTSTFSSQKQENTGPPSFLISDELTAEYDLSQFLFDEKNKLIKEFVRSFVSSPEPDFHENQPLYFCGPSGSGKTHLLQAIARELNDGTKSVLYASGNTFVKHAMKAFRIREMAPFRSFYRNCDVFLLDDIEALANKFVIQEELFHTFNELHLHRKTIIFSAAVHPNDLPDFTARLISRLHWGIVFKVDHVDKGKWRQLLKKRFALSSFPVEKSCIDFFLTQFSSLKLMMQAVERFLFHIELENSHSQPLPALSRKLACDYLDSFIKEVRQHSFSIQDILNVISKITQIEKSLILGRSRKKEVSTARKIAMFLCQKHLRLSSLKMQTIFQRDHSTILVNIASIDQQMKKKQQVYELVNAVEEALQKMHCHAEK